MARARSSTRKVRASHCKKSHGKKGHSCRVKTNRKRQRGGKRSGRSRRTRRRSRGGLGVASAVSTAVLPFGLLWAQRAYKGRKGKSLRKMYRS